MLKKIPVVALGGFLSVVGVSGATMELYTSQGAMVELPDNNRVNYRVRLLAPLILLIN